LFSPAGFNNEPLINRQRPISEEDIPLFKQDFVISVRRLAVVLGILLFSSSAYSQTKLLRFPDISGDRVVLT
jgi:hypothetical protein